MRMPDFGERALDIHKKAIVVDGHNDITCPMVDEDFDLSYEYDREVSPRTGSFPHRYRSPEGRRYHRRVLCDLCRRHRMQTDDSMRRAMDLIDATYREVEKHPRI